LAVNSDLASCPAQIRLVNASIGCAHKHVCMLCDKCQLQSVVLYSQLSSLCCRRSHWLCSEPSCEGCFVAFETKQELQEHHQLVHAPLMPHLPRTQDGTMLTCLLAVHVWTAVQAPCCPSIGQYILCQADSWEFALDCKLHFGRKSVNDCQV